MSIFERYAPFIQDFIYQNNWEALRAIQVAAGDAVFNTDDNVLLTAATASGKTERGLTRAELADAIIEAQSKNPDQPVLIVGDKNVKYEAVLSVMDELQRQQVKRIGLLVQPTGK